MLNVDYGPDRATVAVTGEITDVLAVDLVDCIKKLRSDCFYRRVVLEVTSPGGFGTRPITESALTLFPEPDSPTMARVSPSWSAKVTPSTAGSVPEVVLKTVVRSETRSSLPCIAFNPCAAGDPALRESRRRED